MDRIGLVLLGSGSIAAYREAARRAEDRGFDAVWIAEDYFFRDSVSTAVAIAGATESIEVGIFVNPYTRHPALIAMCAASVDEVSDGRVAVGIGAGSPSVMDRIVDQRAPVQSVRECAEIVRRLLREDVVSHDGRRFSIDSVSLGASPTLSYLGECSDYRAEIPLHVGAKGPRILELAGEVGDGLLTSIGQTPAQVGASIETALANRSAGASGFETTAFVFATADADLARRFAGAKFGAPHERDYVRSADVDDDRLAAIQATVKSEGIDAAADLVTPGMVDSIVATPDGGTALLDRFVDAGVDVPAITYTGTEPVEEVLAIGADWRSG